MFDRDFATIPANLGDLQAGPELGGVLACIEVDRVSPYDRVVVLQAHQRQASHHEAEVYRSMNSVVDGMDDDDPRAAWESAAAEIRAALRLTRTATATELAFSQDLHQRLPRVWYALHTGDLDLRRAKTIARATEHLGVGAARGVVDRIIDAAPNLTTGQLRARIDRLCLEANPAAAQQRYEHRVKDRRVVTESTTSGTANLLGLDMPPHRVNAVMRKINQIARSLNSKDEPRSMDQLRADVFLDLLSGKRDGKKNRDGGVHLRVDLDTLTALSEHPGELEGYGPVIADIARQVAADQQDAEWQYVVTDTATAQPVAVGTTRRRPTTALRRAVEASNPTCVFPGCRMPAVDCDIDHRTRWADGGPTRCCNLSPLCRHDHIIKDQLGWTYRPLTNGDYLWTSRLGHTYTTSGTPP